MSSGLKDVFSRSPFVKCKTYGACESPDPGCIFSKMGASPSSQELSALTWSAQATKHGRGGRAWALSLCPNPTTTSSCGTLGCGTSSLCTSRFLLVRREFNNNIASHTRFHEREHSNAENVTNARESLAVPPFRPQFPVFCVHLR